jgi:hypothetical protein
MCANKTSIEPSTPGVVTFWYRAPEISINEIYSEKIDLWSLGAIIYEMISGHPLFEHQKDTPISLIEYYFKLFPFQASRRTFEKLYQPEKIEMFYNLVSTSKTIKNLNIDKNNFSDDQIIHLTVKRLKGLAAQYTVVLPAHDPFFLLVAKLLSLDPSIRPSAKECLLNTQSMFEKYSPYISSQFSLMASEEAKSAVHNVVKFQRCVHRLKAYKMFVALYNQNGRIPWYSHRILFHAIDLFEMYLAEFFAGPPASPTTVLPAIVANNTDYDVYLKVYVCLYVFHKIFNTMEDPFEWKRFSPKEFSTPENIANAETFEFVLFARVAKCRLYRPTLYEYLVQKEGRESKALIKKCVQALVNLDFVEQSEGNPAATNGLVSFPSYAEIFERIAG